MGLQTVKAIMFNVNMIKKLEGKGLTACNNTKERDVSELYDNEVS